MSTRTFPPRSRGIQSLRGRPSRSFCTLTRPVPRSRPLCAAGADGAVTAVAVGGRGFGASPGEAATAGASGNPKANREPSLSSTVSTAASGFCTSSSQPSFQTASDRSFPRLQRKTRGDADGVSECAGGQLGAGKCDDDGLGGIKILLRRHARRLDVEDNERLVGQDVSTLLRGPGRP
jgi:hypothetical protein